MITAKKQNLKSGFNLMELLVILGIIALVNLVIFSGYSQFNRRITLKRTAAEIAIIVRGAQSDSLAIKKFSNANGSYFPDYGVHFESGRNFVTIFADVDNDNIFDSASECGGNECAEYFKINTPVDISSLSVCQNSSSCANYNKVDIIYPRGRTSALATVSADRGSGLENDSSWSYVRIALISRGNIVPPKYLDIWRNGQISIKDN